jgi:hypothetical protein
VFRLILAISPFRNQLLLMLTLNVLVATISVAVPVMTNGFVAALTATPVDVDQLTVYSLVVLGMLGAKPMLSAQAAIISARLDKFWVQFCGHVLFRKTWMLAQYEHVSESTGATFVASARTPRSVEGARHAPERPFYPRHACTLTQPRSNRRRLPPLTRAQRSPST